MIYLIKKTIRKQILESRANLGKNSHNLYSDRIINKLCESSFYKESKIIMTFISFGHEVNTHNFVKNSLNNNKRITVPITFPESNEIKPSEILDFDELEVGFYNILTPKEEFHRFIDPNEVDLIIVPGLAFDRKGYRVGYGGGYYDRFLSKYPKATKIGLAFDLQMIDQVPRDEFDIAVDYIITENEIIDCHK